MCIALWKQTHKRCGRIGLRCFPLVNESLLLLWRWLRPVWPATKMRFRTFNQAWIRPSSVFFVCRPGSPSLRSNWRWVELPYFFNSRKIQPLRRIENLDSLHWLLAVSLAVLLHNFSTNRTDLKHAKSDSWRFFKWYISHPATHLRNNFSRRAELPRNNLVESKANINNTTAQQTVNTNICEFSQSLVCVCPKLTKHL